jgi:hypothetical protein
MRELEKYLAFSYIALSVRDKKIGFNEEGLKWIEKAEMTLDKAIDGLESVIKGECLLNEDASHLFRIIGGKKDSPKEEIYIIIEKLKLSGMRIKWLKQNSKEFYGSEESRELKNFCDAASQSYI